MTHPIRLGPLSIDPVAFGSQGNAILGIRDSGKSYTATALAEKLFDAGVPFIAFDPIGIWRFLRVPGKGRGYPVVVAGGEEGDLPLTKAGAPEIVRAAMRNGVSLIIDLFDINLSKADWRRIVLTCVQVLLHENKKYGLRHIFIEEAAEFVPQKPLDGEVYAAIEKLARMGGNSRLGYTLINQRSQEVSKAVLELCENVFLHRQRGKNALENLDKWLSIVGAAEQKEIMRSLPDLPQGECWAWLGGDKPQPPVRIKIPAKNSLHPDRRVMHGDKDTKPQGAVDVGRFVEGMKASLATVEAEFNANDPKALRAEIAALKRQLASQPVEKINTPDPEAERRGYDLGFADGSDKILRAVASLANDLSQSIERAEEACAGAKRLLSSFAGFTASQADEIKRRPVARPAPPPIAKREPVRQPLKAANGHDLTGPQRRVLRSLSMWRALGHDSPSREMVAAASGYSPSSGGFNNLLGNLATTGAIGKPMPGHLNLLVAAEEMSADEGRDVLLGYLSNPQRKLVDALNGAGDLSRDELGKRTDYSPSSGGFNNLIGSLSTLGLITKPAAGYVALSPWASELLS